MIDRKTIEELESGSWNYIDIEVDTVVHTVTIRVAGVEPQEPPGEEEQSYFITGEAFVESQTEWLSLYVEYDGDDLTDIGKVEIEEVDNDNMVQGYAKLGELESVDVHLT